MHIYRNHHLLPLIKPHCMARLGWLKPYSRTAMLSAGQESWAHPEMDSSRQSVIGNRKLWDPMLQLQLSQCFLHVQIGNSKIFCSMQMVYSSGHLECVCLVAFDSFVTPWTVTLQAHSVHVEFSGKNTGVGCHYLFQGIFPTGIQFVSLIVNSRF